MRLSLSLQYELAYHLASLSLANREYILLNHQEDTYSSPASSPKKDLRMLHINGLKIQGRNPLG